MLRALLAGGLVAFVSSYVGVFLVQRRMAFLGDGLAHSAFAGVALGLLLNQEPLAFALPFTALVSALITWLTQRGRMGGDAAVGVFFSISMASGIILLSYKQGFTPDAMAYLFGSILTVSTADTFAATSVFILCICSFRLWGRWTYAGFDRESALADGLPVGHDDYLLSGLAAVAVVTAAKLVGIVLLNALLVVPAVAAGFVCRRFSNLTALAVSAALLGTVLGLVLSVLADWPSGAAIVAVLALIFSVLGIIGKRIHGS